MSQNWKSLIERRPDVAPKAKEQESGLSWTDWSLKIGDLTKHDIFTEKALFFVGKLVHLVYLIQIKLINWLSIKSWDDSIITGMGIIMVLHIADLFGLAFLLHICPEKQAELYRTLLFREITGVFFGRSPECLLVKIFGDSADIFRGLRQRNQDVSHNLQLGARCTWRKGSCMNSLMQW